MDPKIGPILRFVPQAHTLENSLNLKLLGFILLGYLGDSSLFDFVKGIYTAFIF